MDKVKIPPIGHSYHTSSLNLIVGDLKEKWGDYFIFKTNEIQTFERRSVTDAMVKDFWKDVSQRIKVHQWKHISHMKLKFDQCQRITNQTLKTIGRNIKDNAKNLSKLSVNFSGCVGIDDQGMEEMNANIRNRLNSLKYYTVNLSSCEGMTNKSLKILNFNNKQLSNLRQFNLNCAVSMKIANPGLKTVGSKLGQHLKALDCLKLDFSRCYAITDAGMAIFSQRLCRYVSHIESLSLVFAGYLIK